MPNIQMPNGDVVAFPDDMPRDQIKGLIATKFPEAAASGPKYNKLESGIQGAAQGASGNFGDEIMAGLMTPVMYAGSRVMDVPGLSDKSFGQIYGQERQKIDNENNRAASDNPLSYTGGAVLGAVGTGLGGAATKGGALLNNSLRTGNTAARITKGAAAGAASGSIYGAGGADEGNRLEGAAKGAGYGALAGGAAPAVGALANSAYKGTKNAIAGATARNVDQLDEALGAIKERSGAAYQAMRDAGAVINKPRSVNIANRVEQAIKNGGALNPRLHATTLGLIDDFKQAARSGEMSLDDLDKWRQTFGQVAGNFNDKLNQRNANIAIEAIDDAVEKLGKIDIRGGNVEAIDALNLGRSEWSRARKFERIVDVIKKAKDDPDVLKRELSKLALKGKRSGFNADDLKDIEKAANQTLGEGGLKLLGKFGFDLGSELKIGRAALPFATSAVGAPGLTALGTAARQGQKYIARGKAENLLKTIEGTAKSVRDSKAISPLLSAPGGAAAGAISGAETRAPARIAITPTALPPVSAPQTPKPQSNNSMFDKIKKVESAGNPNAKNPNSSASGLYQFTDSTWARGVNKYGKDLGITYKDKNNPQAQEKMVRKLASDNAQFIRTKLNIEPNIGDMYAAHFLGAPDAVRLIKAQGSNKLGTALFPKAARANRNIFYDKMRPRSVEEIYAVLKNKVT